MLNLMIMCKNKCVAGYAGGKLEILNRAFLPLYLDRKGMLRAGLNSEL